MAKVEIFMTAVAPSGAVYSLQTGGRVVRHGNPKTKDRRVEIVHVAREKLSGLWVSPSGALHVVGAHYFTNASGKWKRESVPVRDEFDELLAVWAPSDDEVWIGTEEGEVLRRKGGTWEAVDVGLAGDGNFIYAIRGAGPNCIYVMSDQGVGYFDGKKWRRLKPSRSCCYLDALVRSNGHVTIVGRDGPHFFEGSGAKLAAVKGISSDASEDFYAIAGRGKDVYIATGERLLRWNGKKAVDAIPAAAETAPYLECMYVASNNDIVAAGSATGVHIFDGRAWIFSPALPLKRAPRARNAKNRGLSKRTSVTG